MNKQEQIANMAAVIYAGGQKTIEEAILAAEDIVLAVEKRVEALDAWVNPSYQDMREILWEPRTEEDVRKLNEDRHRLSIYEVPKSEVGSDVEEWLAAPAHTAVDLPF